MKHCTECNADLKFRNVGGTSWKTTCLCPDYFAYKPAEPATIIVPSRYPDLFTPCQQSIDKFAPASNKILVRDGDLIQPPTNWTTIQGPAGKFSFSRNINLGIKASKGDVLLTNDDVLFTKAKSVEALQGILADHPEVGILSPFTAGAGTGEYWQTHAEHTLHETRVRLCFVCVLIRRELIDKIGLMDERFDGYGYDDVDYCRRAVNAGYKLGVTGKVSIHHGHKDGKWSTSYRREKETIDQLDKVAGKQFFDKWGDNELDAYADKKPN